MKVSIIVPIFNVSAYLKRCVDSILAQSYTDLEIILVNDGSTDDSGEICKAFAEKDSRIQYIYQENGGLSSARNAGIDIAVGEYFCFVDSDDCILPGYVQSLVSMCLENKVKLAVCGYQLNDSETDPDHAPMPLMLYPTEKIPMRDYFLRIYTSVEVMYIVVWNKLYHRSLFDGVRFAEGKINEDEGIIHKIVSQCPEIAVSGQPLYLYTIRQGSIMSKKSFYPAKLDIFECYSQRMEYFNNNHMDDLTFFTQKNYLTACLAFYNLITDETPDGKMYKIHLMRMYRQVLHTAFSNPCASRRFLAKMQLYSFFPSRFKNVDRNEFLFGSAIQ